MQPLKSTLLTLAILGAVNVGFAASGTDPEKDPQMEKLLWEARHLIDAKKPEAAISKCDAIVSAYKTYYASRKEKIYCGRSGTETLGALLKAGVANENAIALSSTWADAYYMKAYALQEMHRLSEAKATLQLALKLSPFNSQYLAELGEIYSLEKNWAKSMKAFAEAEDNAKLGPEDTQASELGRARRGQGYVLVELGKLDEAEKKYKQCLASNPTDAKAKAELEYVRDQKAKRKAR